jgi:hypothetical protein
MSAKMFQYAILFTPLPSEAQVKAGETPKTEVICDITSLLAKDAAQAAMIAARAVPEQYIDKLDQVEIAVRPF